MDEKTTGGATIEEEKTLTPEEQEQQYLSEFEREKIEDFREKVQQIIEEELKKGKLADPHLSDIHPEDLDNQEHRLFKLYRKFQEDFKDYHRPGWPDIKGHQFFQAVQEYNEDSLEQLITEKGHLDPEVMSKDSFKSYLVNKALAADADYQLEQRKKAA